MYLYAYIYQRDVVITDLALIDIQSFIFPSASSLR